MRERFLVILGAVDTKAAELSFLASALRVAGWPSRIVDIGLRPAAPHGLGDVVSPMALGGDDKPEAMAQMADAARGLVVSWVASGQAAGIVALGGGVGTWIALRVLRELPFGFPKIAVSTLPFDARPELGAKDIVLMPTVTDIIGLSTPLRTVLHNAAAALAGMAGAAPMTVAPRRLVGATCLGVTTPAILALRSALEDTDLDLVAFHAAGLGGAAFEQWTADRVFTAVVDLTTHELAGELFGGTASSGAGRLTAAARSGVPQVIAPGGLDFVSRGPLETLEPADRNRAHFRHSPMFTHVRIDAAGMQRLAGEMARRVNASSAPASVVVPMRGFSAENRPGGALFDPAADAAFVVALKDQLVPRVRVVEVDAHINDPGFATRIAELLLEQVGS